MDKNTIHIDDLVKQHLKGGEEQERPGAWLHMKDLLDNKMPTRVPVAFNWRRMMTYTAAVLAISAAGIGGYKAISSMRNAAHDKAVASSNASTASTSSTTGTANTPAYNSNNANGGNIITANDKDKYTTTNIGADNNANAKNKQTVRKTTVKNNGVKSVPVATLPGNITEKTTASVEGNNKEASKNNSNNPLIDNKVKNNNSSVAANKDKPASKIIPASGNAGKQNKTASVNKPGKNKNKAAQGNKADNKLAVAQPTVSKTNDSIASITVNEKTTIDQRTGKAKFTQEVTGVGKAAMPAIAQRPANSIATAENNYNNPRYVASAANGEVVETPPATAAIMPAATMPIKAAENKNIGLASAHKARKERKGWDFSAVNQFIKDAKYNMSQVNYSTGVTGGFNALFLQGKVLPGFQLGVTETLGISDRISIMLGLKYVQNINRGMVIDDNYVQYTAIGNEEYYRDSMSHFFKFSTRQTLELPVSVHYNVGKFTIFGGGSFVYCLGMTTEDPSELIHRTPNSINKSQLTEAQLASGPSLNTGAFDSRFALGYLAGATYQFAPKLQVDLRFTQNVWDNAVTPGAKIVSNRLYRKPGLQLSVNFNLSKDKKP